MKGREHRYTSLKICEELAQRCTHLVIVITVYVQTLTEFLHNYPFMP